jgi:carboxylate-amine ligase
MKDFYWDIRPKPEYGTVEIRVFDTPLSVERAAALAAYAQTLALHVLADRPLAPSREVYALHSYNRFQACRYGLEARLVDAYTGQAISLRREILDTLALLQPHAAALGNGESLARLAASVEAGYSDADWLRGVHRERGSLNDVARVQSELWMGLIRPEALRTGTA